MTKKQKGRIGLSFDDFLKEEGIYEGVTARAIKVKTFFASGLLQEAVSSDKCLFSILCGKAEKYISSARNYCRLQVFSPVTANSSGLFKTRM